MGAIGAEDAAEIPERREDACGWHSRPCAARERVDRGFPFGRPDLNPSTYTPTPSPHGQISSSHVLPAPNLRQLRRRRPGPTGAPTSRVFSQHLSRSCSVSSPDFRGQRSPVSQSGPATTIGCMRSLFAGNIRSVSHGGPSRARGRRCEAAPGCLRELRPRVRRVWRAAWLADG